VPPIVLVYLRIPLGILTVVFFLVVSRHYGVNGGDPKRIDSKNIILDFQVIKQMTDSAFIETLKSKTEFFTKELIAHKEASGEQSNVFI
jgi:hypothetical protein